jgi:hypothetical protein
LADLDEQPIRPKSPFGRKWAFISNGFMPNELSAKWVSAKRGWPEKYREQFLVNKRLFFVFFNI